MFTSARLFTIHEFTNARFDCIIIFAILYLQFSLLNFLNPNALPPYLDITLHKEFVKSCVYISGQVKESVRPQKKVANAFRALI